MMVRMFSFLTSCRNIFSTRTEQTNLSTIQTNEPPNSGLFKLLNLINFRAKYPNYDVEFQKFDAITQEGRP